VVQDEILTFFTGILFFSPGRDFARRIVKVTPMTAGGEAIYVLLQPGGASSGFLVGNGGVHA
jgi:hypothetical protein